MKNSKKFASLLPLILTTSFSAFAAGTTAVTPPPSYQAVFSGVNNASVFGGVIIRNDSYDINHYRSSISGVVRISPSSTNPNGALAGLQLDHSEIVMQFFAPATAQSQNPAPYAECVLKRADNGNFDKFVSVALSEHSPKNKQQDSDSDSSGNGSYSYGKGIRSYVTETTGFSTTGLAGSYLIKPNEGVCYLITAPTTGTGSTTTTTTTTATSLVANIPAVNLGDMVEVLAIDSYNTTSPSVTLATGTIVAGQ
ncbi:MAG: hypothetical protein ACXWAT_05820 [Methylobacter sp.]